MRPEAPHIVVVGGTGMLSGLVEALGGDGGRLSLLSRRASAFVRDNVRGYDWPRAWLGTPVPSGSRFMISGGVGLSRSSVAVAGLRLEIRTPCNLVAEPSSMRTAVRTNSAGRYSYTLSAAEAREDTWACAAWVIYPTDTPDSWGVQSNIRRHG